MSPQPETTLEDWMLIGIIAGPLGVRGEVKVDLATDFPDRFKGMREVFVGDDHRPMAVRSARRHHDRVALSFVDITDRTAAEALRGLSLQVPRSQAHPLPKGHYYHDQIVGLRVVTTAGVPVGIIEEILSTGNNDVYVTRDQQREVLIPAIHDVVRSIDLVAGTVTVEPIEGLL